MGSILNTRFNALGNVVCGPLGIALGVCWAASGHVGIGAIAVIFGA
jgi:hypothetical protein